MARFDYSGFENTALDLITKFGQPLTLYRETSGDYDPTLGDTATKTVTSTTCEGVAKQGFKGPLNFDDDFKEDLVKGDARLFIIAAKGMTFIPAAGDILDYEGSTWDVHGITPVNPAGTPLAYHLGCRNSGKEIPS